MQYPRDAAIHCTGVIPLSEVTSPSWFEASRRVRDTSVSNSRGEIGGLLAESGFVTVGKTEIHDKEALFFVYMPCITHLFPVYK